MLSAIPTHFTSREEVIAFLKNPFFRGLPEADEIRREDDVLPPQFTKDIKPKTFEDIDLFRFVITGMSIIAYGEIRNQPGRFCVVKFIQPELLREDDAVKMIDRFRREIDFLSRHHRNPFWVRIQKIGNGPHPFLQTPLESPYLVLEFCPGIDGDDFCKALAFREVSSNPAFLGAFALASLQVFADVASEGRVLRDFKVDNVMITPRGFVFLDPGVITEQGSDLTPAGVVMGTPEVMSPEQARRRGESLDFRSDLYALGVCLFYFAAKKYPFEGRNAMEVLRKHIHAPVPMERLNNLPIPLRTVICRLLAKDPQDRFSSLEAAAECFRPFVRGTEMERFLPRILVNPPPFMPTRLDD